MVYILVLLAGLFAAPSVASAACLGALQAANDLSDVCDAAAARANIGAGTGGGSLTSITAGEGLTTTQGSFGGSLTTTGTLYPVLQINPQTGTTYTIVNGDCGKLVQFNNASAVAVTLPQAGAASSFLSGCVLRLANKGAGLVTVTPTTSTIDGLSSRTIQQYGGFVIVSDGTNYQSIGIPPATSSTGVVDGDQLPAPTGGKKGGVIASTCLSLSGADLSVSSNCRTASIQFIIDGGGSAITTGVKGYLSIPFACTITNVTMLADQSGSIVVDIWKDVYSSYPPTDVDSITASAVPTISAATKSTDSTLTGWTTSIAAGDILGFNVDSVSSISLLTISLTCLRS